jgi:hypothetical protein
MQVSMIEASVLDWLDTKVREIRGKTDSPFGGIQVIFVGDFCQVCVCICNMYLCQVIKDGTLGFKVY